MFKRVVILVVICFLSGCSHNATQRTYRDMIYENDFAADRLSPGFFKELKEKCPDMIKDIESLNQRLLQEEASGNKDAYNKAKKEIRWLKGWIKTAGCQYKESAPSSNTGEEKPTSHEMKSSEGKTAHGTEQVIEKKSGPEAVMPLSFDECFKKCKELTNRTNEQCFDTCLHK